MVLTSPGAGGNDCADRQAVADFPGAQVAELVDAQVSGTCGRKVVEVRVFSWAPSSFRRNHPEAIQK